MYQNLDTQLLFYRCIQFSHRFHDHTPFLVVKSIITVNREVNATIGSCTQLYVDHSPVVQVECTSYMTERTIVVFRLWHLQVRKLVQVSDTVVCDMIADSVSDIQAEVTMTIALDRSACDNVGGTYAESCPLVVVIKASLRTKFHLTQSTSSQEWELKQVQDHLWLLT